jgi:hypothetical protein
VFKKGSFQKADKEARILHDPVLGELLSPRQAVHEYGWSEPTLERWCRRCPYLKGKKGLAFYPRLGIFGKKTHYYRRTDLDSIRKSISDLEPCPSLPNKTYFGDVLTDLDISMSTLRRLVKAHKGRITKEWGKAADGRSIPRAYLDNACYTAIRNTVRPGEEKVAEPTAIEHPPQPKTRRGRKPSLETAQIYEYCYTRYIRGDKLTAIRLAATRLFPKATPPKEDRDVTLYAKRYAQRNGLPLSRQNA